MQVLHSEHPTTLAANPALNKLQQEVAKLRQAGLALESFERFEGELHALFVAAERELLAEGLAELDLDLPQIEIAGERHQRGLRATETYTSAGGPITVLRTLYRSTKGGPAVVPLELRAGLIEGHWTGLAAKQAVWVVSHLTPGEGEALFAQLGNMTPSKSSLDRLPKALSGRWEAHREAFEAELRDALVIPPQATTVAVSLDGVMAPMKDAKRAGRAAPSCGKKRGGSNGYQEVGCGTVSLFDADGERLSTIRLARMPEAGKVSLKQQLSAEIAQLLAQRPELVLVKLADGATDNWTYLANALGPGVEVVDFFHAAEHLKRAFDLAYGENSARGGAQFTKYRHILRDEPDGVEKIIRALDYLHRKHPLRRKLTRELGYFRRQRQRMGYAAAKAKNLPIGSGIVEAACKTLVTQRLRRSGMRWRHPGGQAILTFRAQVQSERFELAWPLLAATYKAAVSPLPQAGPRLSLAA